MTEKIVIQGNLVKIIDERVSRICKTDDFFKQLSVGLIFNSKILNNVGLIKIVKKEEFTYYFYVVPEQMRKVTFTEKIYERDDNGEVMLDEDDEEMWHNQNFEYAIPVPRTLFVFKQHVNGNEDKNAVYIYWLDHNEKVNDDTYIYKVLMPNIYTDQKICWGEGNKDSIIRIWKDKPLNEVFEIMSNFFFTAPFNADMSERAKDFKAWENMMKVDNMQFKQALDELLSVTAKLTTIGGILGEEGD